MHIFDDLSESMFVLFDTFPNLSIRTFSALYRNDSSSFIFETYFITMKQIINS